MSENVTQAPELRYLSKEEIARLIERVEKEGSREARYVLKLRIQSRFDCGYRYNWREDVEVIYGEADIIDLSRSRDECYDERELAVIPKTVPVVLILRHEDDQPQHSKAITYVFTGEEWKSVESRYIH